VTLLFVHSTFSAVGFKRQRLPAAVDTAVPVPVATSPGAPRQQEPVQPSAGERHNPLVKEAGIKPGRERPPRQSTVRIQVPSGSSGSSTELHAMLEPLPLPDQPPARSDAVPSPFHGDAGHLPTNSSAQVPSPPSSEDDRETAALNGTSPPGLPKLDFDPFAPSDFPPVLPGERHPVLDDLLRAWLISPEGVNASLAPPVGNATAMGGNNVSAAQLQPRKITVALRDEDPAPSAEMYEAAKAAFDTTGALLATDLEGRPLRSRCWVATQPMLVAAGKPNCAMSADGNKCLHCWPSWFLIGAPKAGTTVLWQSLRYHPQVVPRGGKEWHYWDWLWPSNGGSDSLARTERYTDDGGGDYMRHQAAAKAGGLLGMAFGKDGSTQQERNRLPFLIGDGDPNYLYSPMRFPWDSGEPAMYTEVAAAEGESGEESGQAAAPAEAQRRTMSTAEVMRAVIPDARLVVMLREPGARALSHMRMTCEGACRREAGGNVTRSRAHQRDLERCIRCPVDAAQWAEVVERELRDLEALCTGKEALAAGAADAVLAADCFAPRALHDAGGDRLALRAMSTGTWVGRSIYYHWLDDWLRVWPRDQLHIIRYEDWAAEPGKVTHRVLDFLGARRWEGLEGHLPKPRVATAGDDVHASTPETRAKLKAFYAPFNARLAALLNDSRWLWADA
jgi:hypothetical protein